MVETARLHQRVLQIAHDRVVERFHDIEHHLLIGRALVRQFRVVVEEGPGLRGDPPGVELLDLLIRLFEDSRAVVIAAGKVQRHAAVHAIENLAFGAILLLRLLHDRIGADGITHPQAFVDQGIAVDGRTAGAQEKRQAGEAEKRGGEAMRDHV
jgi:hypothetical protein